MACRKMRSPVQSSRRLQKFPVQVIWRQLSEPSRPQQLKAVGKDDWAIFVGQWPAAFMLMGVYNKMVKQHGSDAYSKVQ